MNNERYPLPYLFEGARSRTTVTSRNPGTILTNLPYLPVEIRELIDRRRPFIRNVNNMRTELRRLRTLLSQSLYPETGVQYPGGRTTTRRRRIRNVMRYISTLLRQLRALLGSAVGSVVTPGAPRTQAQGPALLNAISSRYRNIRSDMRQSGFMNVNLYRDVRNAVEGRENYDRVPDRRFIAPERGSIDIDHGFVLPNQEAPFRYAPGL